MPSSERRRQYQRNFQLFSWPPMNQISTNTQLIWDYEGLNKPTTNKERKKTFKSEKPETKSEPK